MPPIDEGYSKPTIPPRYTTSRISNQLFHHKNFDLFLYVIKYDKFEKYLEQ